MGYKATEDAAVSGFNKVLDKFIETFFTKDNETIEEAKVRLSAAASSKNSSLSKSDEELREYDDCDKIHIEK